MEIVCIESFFEAPFRVLRKTISFSDLKSRFYKELFFSYRDYWRRHRFVII